MNQGRDARIYPREQLDSLPRRPVVTPSVEPYKLRLGARVIGQETPVEAMAELLQLIEEGQGLGRGNRPIMSYIFVGPSGVGKTELVFAVAQDLLQRNPNLNQGNVVTDPIIKIDCAQFALEHSLTRLTGSPPGYIGSRGHASYIAPVFVPENLERHSIHFKRKDGGVDKVIFVLLDELERAHPSFYDQVLSLADRGDFPLADGTRPDFSKIVLISTSNLGLKEVESADNTLGFKRDTLETQDRDRIHLKALEDRFGAPFVGRMTKVAFRSLTSEELRAIACVKVVEAENELGAAGLHISLAFTEEAMEFLISHNVSAAEGARPVVGNLKKFVFDPISKIAPQLNGNKLLVSKLDDTDSLQIEEYGRVQGADGKATEHRSRLSAEPTFRQLFDTAKDTREFEQLFGPRRQVGENTREGRGNGSSSDVRRGNSGDSQTGYSNDELKEAVRRAVAALAEGGPSAAIECRCVATSAEYIDGIPRSLIFESPQLKEAVGIHLALALARNGVPGFRKCLKKYAENQVCTREDGTSHLRVQEQALRCLQAVLTHEHPILRFIQTPLQTFLKLREELSREGILPNPAAVTSDPTILGLLFSHAARALEKDGIEKYISIRRELAATNLITAVACNNSAEVRESAAQLLRRTPETAPKGSLLKKRLYEEGLIP